MKQLLWILLLLISNLSLGQVPKGMVVFASTQLYSVKGNGTGERRITTSGNNDLPSVYHNRVVYRQTGPKGTSFLITGINGGQPKTLTENKGGCYPRWSRDGKLVAYEYSEDSVCGIWVVDTNGKNKHKLVSDAQHPFWCDDNKTMLFTRGYEIWSLDLVKGSERKLTNLKSKGLHAKWPALSPDGSHVAFLGFDSTRQGIFVANLRDEKDLKFFDKCDDPPCWTNDPKFFVCSALSKEKKHWEIVMVNMETGEKVFITKNNRDNYMPVWINDSPHSLQ